MAINQYDAIVVGARCAGSPTTMLLARKGYKVLVVDRARFPSDTVSTHLLHPPGGGRPGPLGAIHGNQEAMDGFARVIAGVTSPAEFFSEENVRRITLRAGAAAPA